MAPREEHRIPESSLPQSFDPYLRYAIAAEFTNFECFDEKNFRLFFLVEFKRAGLAQAFEEAMRAAEFEVEFCPRDDRSRYATLRTHKATVTDRRAYPIWNEFVSRVELSLPIMPSRAPPLSPRFLHPRWEDGEDSHGSVLIGILDDGCPFAAAQFLRAPASTRVRAIWDQNRDKEPIATKDGAGNPRIFGRKLTDFDYGLEFRRDISPVFPPSQEMGLDEWIELHSTAGIVDEDGCYAEADVRNLWRRQSHGAHVMDVFAGRVPTASRVGAAPPGEDRRDPPSWAAGSDAACSADLVFVQFSEECIRDATGVWLKGYVYDGIRYILSFADPTITEKVVINLSYGPTTGPHDGTAQLETILTAFVTEFNGTPGKPKLEIVLPAGNAYLSEGHVSFARQGKQPDHIEWTWRLPPDNSVLCFAEVWMDSANAGGVDVSLTSPSGAIAPTLPGAALPLLTGVYGPVAWGSHTMWVLAVAATQVGAEHGDWGIKVNGIAAGAQVHAYVARSDPNMGVRSGAKLSYFVDHNWEITRSAEASCNYADGEFDKAGSLINRCGTLNGIATGTDSSVHVAGGYILANGRKSPYSSAGPARNGPLPLRLGPDNALPGDESYALRGIRAGGNRSGTVFRLIGTSAAAPQLARHIADPPIPPATNVTVNAEEVAKRGSGN
ncbi:MAG TPA: hypothetical protein VEQ63_08265, partial [Bryobacteraceae bacterium]|nr:hypothetical protein [Bryobacteraceae bacterium]